MTAKEAIARISAHMEVHRIGEAPHIHIADALNMAIAALKDQEERENPKRLTIEELKSINAPVWLSCFTFEGDPGYWCLCHKGIIICPSGQCFEAAEIPNWKFYIHKPKEG